MTTQQQMINAAAIENNVSYRNYKKFGFSMLRCGCNRNCHEADFIGYHGITFEDYVGHWYLTGNELFCYPELAQKIQALKEYPTLKRTYQVDDSIQGLAFIDYFYRRVLDTFNTFQHELAAASCVVDNLVHLYGTERTTPIIDAIKLEETSYHKKLVINGISWPLEAGFQDKLKVTEFIDIRKLLGIPHEMKCIALEDACLGTSFLALRISKTWRHKGHVQWYNLDTLKPVSKKNIPKQ